MVPLTVPLGPHGKLTSNTLERQVFSLGSGSQCAEDEDAIVEEKVCKVHEVSHEQHTYTERKSPRRNFFLWQR